MCIHVYVCVYKDHRGSAGSFCIRVSHRHLSVEALQSAFTIQASQSLKCVYVCVYKVPRGFAELPVFRNFGPKCAHLFMYVFMNP